MYFLWLPKKDIVPIGALVVITVKFLSRTEQMVVIMFYFALFTHGIGLGETSFVLPFDYLRIVYAFAFGALVFAELPDVWGITGAAIIVVSSVWLLRGEERR